MCHQFVIIKQAELAQIAQEVHEAAVRRRLLEYPLDPPATQVVDWWPSDRAAKAEETDKSRGETKRATRKGGDKGGEQLSLFGDPDTNAFDDSVGDKTPDNAGGLIRGVTFPKYAFPDKPAPILAASGQGTQLEEAIMAWGFEVPWKKGPVFNARLETAMGPKDSMWSRSLARRRCLVPTTGFFEHSETETFPSPRTGKPIRRVYEFEAPERRPFLMAGIYDRDRFSLLTIDAPARFAAIHGRLPFVLTVDQAVSWLMGDYEAILNQPYASLLAEPQTP